VGLGGSGSAAQLYVMRLKTPPTSASCAHSREPIDVRGPSSRTMEAMLEQRVTFPSSRHKKLIGHLYATCLRMECGMAITGSVAKGTATSYSDIDVLLFGLPNGSCVDPFIEFGTPLMVNLTVRPPGIVIACFPMGLCIDLDVRKNATTPELGESVILIDRGIQRTSSEIQRIEVVSKYLNVNPLHRNLRLLHKAMLKYLCAKMDSAADLIAELNVMNAEMGIGCDRVGTSLVQDARDIYQKMRSTYPIEPSLDREFRYLLRKARDA
jgi:hypothetical protein